MLGRNVAKKKAFSLAEKVGNSPANCSDKGFVAQATKELPPCRESSPSSPVGGFAGKIIRGYPYGYPLMMVPATYVLLFI